MKALCVVEPGNAPSTRSRLRDCVELYRKFGVETKVISRRRADLAKRSRLLMEAARHDVAVHISSRRSLACNFISASTHF